jgi:tetratricopeptide (TPR) repeat protein
VPGGDDAHLQPEVIGAWVRGEQREGRRILRHLLGCGRCAGVACDLLAETERAEGARNLARDAEGAPYRDLWQRLDDRLARDEAYLRRARQEAAALVSELLDRPVPGQAAAAEPRFQTWAVAEHLLELAAGAATDPARAVPLAELATAITRRLSPAEHPPSLLQDVHAEALVRLGEARRLAGDLRQAAESLRLADETAGTEAWSARGEFCRVLARLRQDQGRTDEALALFTRAADLLEDLGRPGQAVEALAEAGSLDLSLWRIEEAAAAFDAAVALCSAVAGPDAIRALEAAAWSLERQGRTAAARQLLDHGSQHLGESGPRG